MSHVRSIYVLCTGDTLAISLRSIILFETKLYQILNFRGKVLPREK